MTLFHRVNLVRMEIPVNQAPRDLVVTQERTVIRVPSAHPAPQVVQERGVPPALLVLEVSRVFPAPQVLRVPAARTERLVCRVRGVFLEVWVSGVSEDSRENVGLRVPQENLANVENQGSQDLMAPQVLPAPLDRRDIQDHLASW